MITYGQPPAVRFCLETEDFTIWYNLTNGIGRVSFGSTVHGEEVG